jgi:hypothetical protein
MPNSDYPQEAENWMSKVRKLTARIGKAKKDGDGGSTANYRDSRNKLLQSLADKYDIHYWVDEEGKSRFGSYDEAKENMDTEAIQIANATESLYGTLKNLDATKKKYESMEAQELKDFLVKTLTKQIEKCSTELHRIQEEAGQTKTDLSFLEEQDDAITGIDWDSLNDENKEEESDD